MSKSSKNSFLMQGMILAAASIVCRVIGLLYRSPLFGIIGKEGMGYYSYAYNIYNIILLSHPLVFHLRYPNQFLQDLRRKNISMLRESSMEH